MSTVPSRRPRIVVIGARGFLGTPLVRGLTANGLPVAEFTRSRPFLHAGLPDAALREAEVIVYLAASVTSASADRFPARIASDIAVFRDLLDALRRIDAQPTVVYTSSSMVYDPDVSPPYSETSPTRANTSYGAAKLDMENTLLEHCDAVRPVILRLASIYGPGHRTDVSHGVIGHWLTAVASGRALDLMGDPGIRRDYVYVDDVVDAMLRITSTTSGQLPRILNIGSGAPASLEQLLTAVGTVTARSPSVRRQPGRDSDRPAIWLDIRRASAALDWRPRTTLATGLTHTWRAINGHATPRPSTPGPPPCAPS